MDGTRLCTSHHAKEGWRNGNKEEMWLQSPAPCFALTSYAGCGRTILTILCLSALIWRVWITSFISLRTELLSATAARSYASSPGLLQPGEEQHHQLLLDRGHLNKARPILTVKLHLPPPQIREPEQELLHWSKTWRKGSSQRKLGPVLLYGLPKLGSYSWGHRVSQSKSTRLGRQHFPVFVPNTCFSTVQNTFFLLLVTKKRRTNLLSLSKSLLLFT